MLTLESFRANQHATIFYKKNGWLEAGIRGRQLAVDKIVFTKRRAGN